MSVRAITTNIRYRIIRLSCRTNSCSGSVWNRIGCSDWWRNSRVHSRVFRM